jgi:hypothetical protein
MRPLRVAAVDDHLTRRFCGSSVEAQIAGDCWLYGHVFMLAGQRYTITRYYLTGDPDIVVVVTLKPQD